MDDLLHFRAAGTSLVLDLSGSGLPRIVHWGADLGALAPGRLAGLRTADVAQTVSNALDVPVPLSVLPQQSAGRLGTPGLSGHRESSATPAGLIPVICAGERHAEGLGTAVDETLTQVRAALAAPHRAARSSSPTSRSGRSAPARRHPPGMSARWPEPSATRCGITTYAGG
ncbi:hypothetical protein ACFTZK_20560 [Streptomyces decoyicus]|uniref:hypothetical protein n=1 Tax=Streptomyces decoyicus TaxID=249567 RepID=UPI00362F7F10